MLQRHLDTHPLIPSRRPRACLLACRSASRRPRHQTPASTIPTRLIPSCAADSRQFPIPKSPRRPRIRLRDRRHRDENADQGSRFGRPRQHARRSGEQRDHEGRRSHLEDEVDSAEFRVVLESASRRPGGEHPDRCDDHRHRKPRRRATAARRARSAAPHQGDRERGQRTELRADHHRPHHRHCRVGNHADRGKQHARHRNVR